MRYMSLIIISFLALYNPFDKIYLLALTHLKDGSVMHPEATSRSFSVHLRFDNLLAIIAMPR
jgi:hypothetical protein